MHNNPVICPSIHTVSKTYFVDVVDRGPNKKSASLCGTLFQKAMSEAETKFQCSTVRVATDNELKM